MTKGCRVEGEAQPADRTLWGSVSHVYIFQVKEGRQGKGGSCSTVHKQELMESAWTWDSCYFEARVSAHECLLSCGHCWLWSRPWDERGARRFRRRSSRTEGSVKPRGLRNGVNVPSLYLGLPNPFASRGSWGVTRDNDGVPLQRGHRTCRCAQRLT